MEAHTVHTNSPLSAHQPKSFVDPLAKSVVLLWLGVLPLIQPACALADVNWVRVGGGLAGVNGDIIAAALDALGNLYIGGYFTVAGQVPAKGVAKWNGSAWSALGQGLEGDIYAIAVELNR